MTNDNSFAIEVMLQEKLEKHFSNFLGISVNGIKINMLPMYRDIPKIKKVHRNENSIEFEFQTKDSNKTRVSSYSNEWVEFIVDEFNSLTKIVIRDLRKLESDLSFYNSQINGSLKEESSLKKKNQYTRSLKFINDVVKSKEKLQLA